jgi:hypothetical protein
MIILDTDHLTVLRYPEHSQYETLELIDFLTTFDSTIFSGLVNVLHRPK